MIRISSVIYIINIVATVTMLVFFLLYFLYFRHEHYKENLSQMKYNYMQEYENRLKSKMNETVSYIEYEVSLTENRLKKEIQDRVEDSINIATEFVSKYHDKTSLNDIKEMVKTSLRSYRFHDSQGYIFAATIDGVEVLYPIHPEFENKSVINLQDSRGDFIIKKEIDIVKKYGEGFAKGYWKKPDGDPSKDYLKLSFVKYFKPFDWYFGSGLYLDDVSLKIKNEIIHRIKNFRDKGEEIFYIFSEDKELIVCSDVFEMSNKNIDWVDAPFEFSKANLKGFGINSKIFYYQKISGWNWLVVVALSSEELDLKIENNEKTLIESLKRDIYFSFLFFLIILVTSVFSSYKFIKRLKLEFKIFSTNRNKIIPLENLGFYEFYSAGKTLNQVLIELNNVNEKQKEIEIDLQKAKDDAENANKAKGIFLANMSHEIRTPLNAILGFTELLLEDSLTEKQKSKLSIILQSSKELLSLLNDILDFSKIEANKLKIESHAFSIKELLQRLYTLFETRASQKGIIFKLDLPTNVPSEIVSDELRVAQILSNLLSNAIKFTNQGVITIGVNIFNNIKGDNELYFYVSDTGMGIATDKIESIFSPFEQGSNRITKEYGGTGLGLAISKNLAKLMGGDLFVSSTLGKGSIFTLKLPIFNFISSIKGRDMVSDWLNKEEWLIPVILLAIKEYPNYLEKIKNAFKDADYELLKREAHSLKGAFGNVEIEEIYSIAKELEVAAKEQNDELISKSINELDVIYKKIPNKYFLDDFDYYTNLSNKNSSNSTLEIDNTQNLISNSKINNVLSESNLNLKNDNSKNNKILIVDDNQINRELMGEIFQILTLSVMFAVNGKEAIELVEKNSFDIIFMDIEMPIMTGEEATKIIKKINNNIKIIALTANALSGDRERYLSMGFDDYLSKPVSKKMVKEMIDKYLKIDYA
ncbi:cache domain-containing protein [bacterium]|nr:cache domain-containing protein [bacterium]